MVGPCDFRAQEGSLANSILKLVKTKIPNIFIYKIILLLCTYSVTHLLVRAYVEDI